MGHQRTPTPILRALLILIAALSVAIQTPPAGAQDTQTDAAAEPQGSQDPATAELDPERGLESPRATLRTFLTAMHPPTGPGQEAPDPDMDQALRCIAFPPGLLQSTKTQTAVEILDVLNRLERVDYADHPGAGFDKTTYVFFPNTTRSLRHLAWANKYPDARITLTRDEEGSWRFSRKTAETIHTLWIEVEGEKEIVEAAAGTRTMLQRIRTQIPSSLKGSLVLGLEPWQWIGILVVVVIGVIVDHISRFVLRTFWHRFEHRRGNEVEHEVLARAVRPFGLLAAAGIWYVALDQGLLPATATAVLLVAVRLFLMVSSVWAAFRVTDLGCAWLSTQAEKTETKFDDLLVPLLKRAIKIFVTAFGLIYLASAFDIEILPLLTGLGIGGLAVAFAAKDTIENFFGSVSVILDRPFEIGDWIETNGVEGTVEDMGFRSTRIRTFYNSLVTVPNATLVRATVDNYGRRSYRRFKTAINVTYDTHPDKIEAFCAGIREIIKLHPYTRKDYYHVWLNSFGAHSLDILVYMFFECPDWSIELRERHRFMLDVIRLADRLGVEFAFPTQTLHVAQLDPDAPHHPSEIPETDSECRAILEGRKLARELTEHQPWKDTPPGPVTFAEAYESEHEARGNADG